MSGRQAVEKHPVAFDFYTPPINQPRVKNTIIWFSRPLQREPNLFYPFDFGG